MSLGLPEFAPCSWSNERLYLRYPVPRIWTQKSSRAFGIYWSDRLSYGRLWPEPSDSELNAFYDIASYREYLSGKPKPKLSKQTFLARVVMKIVYLKDHGIEDPIPSIFDLTNAHPTICDIGCGGGNFLSEVRQRGATPLGIDPSTLSRMQLPRDISNFILAPLKIFQLLWMERNSMP